MGRWGGMGRGLGMRGELDALFDLSSRSEWSEVTDVGVRASIDRNDDLFLLSLMSSFDETTVCSGDGVSVRIEVSARLLMA